MYYSISLKLNLQYQTWNRPFIHIQQIYTVLIYNHINLLYFHFRNRNGISCLFFSMKPVSFLNQSTVAVIDKIARRFNFTSFCESNHTRHFPNLCIIRRNLTLNIVIHTQSRYANNICTIPSNYRIWKAVEINCFFLFIFKNAFVVF